MQKRCKSVVMWIGIIGAAFLAVGIKWQDMTSWQILGRTLLDFIKNPAQIILFGITIYSIMNNPTNGEGF